jgi:hypothetical protein
MALSVYDFGKVEENVILHDCLPGHPHLGKDEFPFAALLRAWWFVSDRRQLDSNARPPCIEAFEARTHIVAGHFYLDGNGLLLWRLCPHPARIIQLIPTAAHFDNVAFQKLLVMEPILVWVCQGIHDADFDGWLYSAIAVGNIESRSFCRCSYSLFTPTHSVCHTCGTKRREHEQHEQQPDRGLLSASPDLPHRSLRSHDVAALCSKDRHAKRSGTTLDSRSDCDYGIVFSSDDLPLRRCAKRLPPVTDFPRVGFPLKIFD